MQRGKEHSRPQVQQVQKNLPSPHVQGQDESWDTEGESVDAGERSGNVRKK